MTWVCWLAFCGMEVERDPKTGHVQLTQKAYTADQLASYGMSAARPRPVPMSIGTALVSGPGGSDAEDEGMVSRYGSLVGALLYRY